MANNRHIKKQTKTLPDLISTPEALSLSADELLNRMATSATGLTELKRPKNGWKSMVLMRWLKTKRDPPPRISFPFQKSGNHYPHHRRIFSGFLGDPLDAGIIILIVLISVTLDFTQEYRAGRAAEALQKEWPRQLRFSETAQSRISRIRNWSPGTSCSCRPEILSRRMPG